MAELTKIVNVSGTLSGTRYISGTATVPATLHYNNVQYNTTAAWNEQLSLVAQEGVLYVYSDYKTITVDGSTTYVAGMKIGDGTSYLIDLPFLADDIAADLEAHINDTTVHITEEERVFWNNKVSADVDGEYLVLSTD